MVVYNYNGMKNDGLILRKGMPLLWQFDGGYVDLDANGTPTSWNYYVTDHLGSTRMVVDSNDSIKNRRDRSLRFSGEVLSDESIFTLYDKRSIFFLYVY